eukprot:2820797-Prymnesium_polylepis.1
MRDTISSSLPSATAARPVTRLLSKARAVRVHGAKCVDSWARGRLTAAHARGPYYLCGTLPTWPEGCMNSAARVLSPLSHVPPVSRNVFTSCV